MSYHRPWELWPGALLIALGVLFLLDTLGVVSAGRVLSTYWPVLVIAAGLLLLWGAGRWGPAGPLGRVVGDIRIGQEEWELRDTETSLGIGDLRLDLRRARIPAGETTIRIKGGIADIKVVVPQGLAVSAQSRVGMGSINLLGHKADGFSRQLSFVSPDYAAADKKVKVHMNLLIGDTSIVRRE